MSVAIFMSVEYRYKLYVSVKDVIKAVNHLKNGKCDGELDLTSYYINNGSDKLSVVLYLLFDAMICHGTVLNEFLASTHVPIPQKKRKYLTIQTIIALSSICGKLLDLIIMNN